MLEATISDHYYSGKSHDLEMAHAVIELIPKLYGM